LPHDGAFVADDRSRPAVGWQSPPQVSACRHRVSNAAILTSQKKRQCFPRHLRLLSSFKASDTEAPARFKQPILAPQPSDAAARGRNVDLPRSQIGLATHANNHTVVRVSLFWLTYQRAGRLFGVVILDSTSLIAARQRASTDQVDGGAQFAGGSELDAKLAALVPPTSIGRMLAPKETYALLKKFDRGVTKRPAAPSIPRRQDQAGGGRKSS
jgi:hypothetical protein